MASQVPPKKNAAFNLGLTLYKNDGTLIANPGTLTAKISKDFGDYADIGTTSKEDSTYGQIKLALTATEMNADVVMIYVVDNTSGCVPFTATIYTAANLMDDIKTDTAAILADTGTDGVVLAADAITAAKIADDAFSSEHFATGCISADAVADGTIDAGALAADCITSAKIADDALGAEHIADSLYAQLGIVTAGTAQSATSTTLVLAASSAFADDELNGAVVVITGGTGVGQSRVITNYTGSTDTAEVDAWTTTPSGTITYVVFAASPASATSLPAVNLTQIAGSAVSTSTAQLGVNVVSVTADAIDAAAIKADAGTEIGTAVWATTARTLTAATNITSTGGTTVPQTGDSYAIVNGDHGLVSIQDDVDAIKTKTDFLPSATAGTAGGVFIAGANAATSVSTALTANITGNLSGSVGSVTGSIGSVALKKNTALAKFPFVMRDSTNHAPATGLTVTATRSIDGAAFGAGSLSAVTELGSGVYTVDFAGADLNGATVLLKCTAAGADDLLLTIITNP